MGEEERRRKIIQPCLHGERRCVPGLRKEEQENQKGDFKEEV